MMKKSLYIALTAALLQTTSLYGAAIGGAGDVNLLTDPRGTNPRAFVYNPQDATGAKDSRVDAIKEAQFKLQEAIRELRQIGERFTGYFAEIAGACGGAFEAEPIDAHMASEIPAIRGRLSASFEAITDRALKDSLMGKILPLFDTVAARYGSIWNPLLPEVRIIEDFLRSTELNHEEKHLKAVYVDGGEAPSSVYVHGRTGVSLDAIRDMLNRAGAVRTEYETALALHPFFAFPVQPLILWVSDTDHFYHYDTGSRQFTRREFPLSWRGLFDSYARGAGPEERLRAEAAVIADIATDKQLLAPTTVTVETLPAPSYGAGRMVLHSKTDIINAANRRAGLNLVAHDAGVGAAGAGAPRGADGRDALADAEAKRIKIAASQFTAEEFEGLVALGDAIDDIATRSRDASESIMSYGRLAKDRLASGLTQGESTKQLLTTQLERRHAALLAGSVEDLKDWFTIVLTALNKREEIIGIHRALDYTYTKANTPDTGDAESQPFNRQFIEALWELRSFYEGHRAVLGSNPALREDFNVRLDFLLDTIRAHYDHCPQGAIGRALWTRYILCQFIADHGAMLNDARAALPAAGGAGASALNAGPVVGEVPLAVKLAQTSAAMPVASVFTVAPTGGPGFAAAAVAAAPLGDVWGGPRAFATAAAAHVPAPVAAGGFWAQPAGAVAGGRWTAPAAPVVTHIQACQEQLIKLGINLRDVKTFLESEFGADILQQGGIEMALSAAGIEEQVMMAMSNGQSLDTILEAIQTPAIAVAPAAVRVPGLGYGVAPDVRAADVLPPAGVGPAGGGYGVGAGREAHLLPRAARVAEAQPAWMDGAGAYGGLFERLGLAGPVREVDALPPAAPAGGHGGARSGALPWERAASPRRSAAAEARRDAEAQRAVEAQRIAEREAAERAAADVRRAAAEDAARRAAELEAARIAAEVRAVERAAAESEHLRTADEARRLGEIEVAEIEAAKALAEGRYRIDHLPAAYKPLANALWLKFRGKGMSEHQYANAIHGYLEANPGATPESLEKQMKFW